MGLGGISLPQLLIVLAIVLLVFGTKRVKSIGSDLGGAIRGFRNAMETEAKKPDADMAAQRRIAAVETEPTAETAARADEKTSR